MINFSFKRMLAIARKEFIKIKLDKAALRFIFMIPVIQIIIFGYAIELFPKHLPTAVISYDDSPFTRQFIQALESTTYFTVKYGKENENRAKDRLRSGDVNYILTIPPQFTQDLIRGNHPHILLEADASTPGAMGGAIQAATKLQDLVFVNDTQQGSLTYLAGGTPPFNVDVHALYNPNLESTYTIIPGLIGMILMLSLSNLTAATIIEEKVAGNIEVLLNSSVQPLEIMFGKTLSYLVIGYILLITIIFLSTKLLFSVPLRGSLITMLIVTFPFMLSILMLGIAASTLAKTQAQAAQLNGFFSLPSLMLSGFMFPFYGMPGWAQVVGNILPLTHYIRISSGIMLKDYGWYNILPDLWPILLFAAVTTYLSITAFKRTLD